jgi:hypothetical protein
MSGDLDRLPPDVSALLSVERLRVGAPDEGRARLAARLSAAVPAFGPLHVAPSAPPPAPHVLPTLASSGAAKAGLAKVILALAIGGGAAATLLRPGTLAQPHADSHATVGTAPVEEAKTADPVATSAPLNAPVSGQLNAPIADQATFPLNEPTSELKNAARSAAPPAKPESVSSEASLLDERRLLDAARDAIVRGEPEGALVPTSTHAARFPHGALAEERDALRIRALARLGKTSEARALLTTMRAKYPYSFLLEGAANDVDTIP